MSSISAHPLSNQHHLIQPQVRIYLTARGRPSALTYAEVNKNKTQKTNEKVTMNENVQRENDSEEAENKDHGYMLVYNKKIF